MVRIKQKKFKAFFQLILLDFDKNSVKNFVK